MKEVDGAIPHVQDGVTLHNSSITKKKLSTNGYTVTLTTTHCTDVRPAWNSGQAWAPKVSSHVIEGWGMPANLPASWSVSPCSVG